MNDGTERSLFVLVAILVSTAALWRIFVRAGFQGAWGLLGLLPGLGLLLAGVVLAFRDWPAAQHLRVEDAQP